MACQSMRFPRRSVTVVPHADIQREILRYSPVVFEEAGPVILMDVSRPSDGFLVIVESSRRRAVNKKSLRHLVDGSS